MSSSKISILFLSTLTLIGCQTQQQPQEESDIFNLLDSTTIVRTLISNNAVATILEDADEEQITVLLNNFSPAEIAFETEVLSCTLPTLLYFFDRHSTDHPNMVPIFKQLAQDFENQIKIVMIDVQALFVIADKSDITAVPTFMIVDKRKEIKRLEGTLTQKALQDMIEHFLHTSAS